MKKNFIFVIIFSFFINFVFSVDLATTLLVVEETENNFTTVKESTPFTDGIIDALWEKPFVFFDMKIEKPLTKYSNSLDIRPFLQEAKQSGADSLLLIKFVYKVELDEKGNMKLSITDIPYHLYSVRDLKVLKSGTKKVNVNKVVSPKEKERILHDVGKELANNIFE